MTYEQNLIESARESGPNKAWLAAVVAGTLALGGCASTQAEEQMTYDIRAQDYESFEQPQPEAEPEEPVIKTVAEEEIWQPGTFQEGLQLYWHTKGTAEHIQSVASQNLDYVVSLGANAVGLSFPIYTNGVTPNHVYTENAETPSPEELAIVIAEAKRRNLRVMVRPLIDEVNIAAEGDDAWRGNINPINVHDWFVSYGDALEQYVPVLADAGVEEFVLGVELFSLQGYTQEWQDLQQRLTNAGYTGSYSYVVNWDSQTKPPFEHIGVDAYPSINLPDTATVEELTEQLRLWLETQSVDMRQELTIHEAGIPARSGSYPNPWYWGSVQTDTLNLEVQTNWFAAICDAARQSETQGLYYWMIDSNTLPSGVDLATLPPKDFMGRPAELAIKTCFNAPTE